MRESVHKNKKKSTLNVNGGAYFKELTCAPLLFFTLRALRGKKRPGRPRALGVTSYLAPPLMTSQQTRDVIPSPSANDVTTDP